MASLNFKGKSAVWNHHLSVPYHTLENDAKLSLKGENADENLIIEGDNLLALKSLLPKYQGKVKCIYIDPPYNTGNENWVYSDNVNSPTIQEWVGETVGKDDLTRHDKWLSMMTPRLKLLRDLLAHDGVILVSIDENESHRLRQLLDEIFGAENFIGEFIWKNKHGGGGDSPYLVKEHEHIFVFALSLTDLPELFVTPTAEYEKMFRLEDEKGKYYLDRLDKKGIATDRPNLIYEIECPDGTMKSAAPTPWRLSTKEFERRKANNEIVFKKDKNDEWQIYTKTYLVDEEGNSRLVKARSILKQEIVGFTQDGNKEIEELLGDRSFSNPKPTRLIKYLLDYVTRDDQNCIVLDSFAGSGTTAHAVLDQNKEDGGNRKFILVEMESYANKTTAERVRRAIKKFGYRAGFTYSKLGPAIDAETILSGKLPTYKEFAKYVYYLATGKNHPAESKIKEDESFVGAADRESIYLIYEKDTEKLKKLAITLDWAQKAHKKDSGKKIVYAPACFLDDEALEQYNIKFVSIPYNLFERTA